MKFKIEITEKMKTVVEINARSVTEALAKAERRYYADQTEGFDLSGVEFTAVLDGDKVVTKEG